MDLKDQRILVTGGAGFIGSQLTTRLLDQGATVHVVDNLFAGRDGLVDERATFHEADIRDRSSLRAVLEETAPRLVYHLAAIHYVPYCNEHPEEAVEVNVSGTRNLLEGAKDQEDLERVVYASSAAVYPPREEPNMETSEARPVDIYGNTKLIGEERLELFHHLTGVQSVSARLFNVYGPNETNSHLIPAIIDQLRDGRREIELGNLTPKRDFIHVADVVDALVEMATAFDGDYRAYNVGTGREYSVEEVVEAAAAALGEEIAITQSADRQRESDRPRLRADISRIEAELGWSPEKSFMEGLRDLLEMEGVVR